MTRRVFFDTEFTDLTANAALISAGFITDAGETYYAELADFEESACSQFVRNTVLLLSQPRLATAAFVQGLTAWLGPAPQLLIADSDWDPRILARTFAVAGLFLPEHWRFLVAPACYSEGWRRRLFDDEMAAYSLRHPENPPHHALADARALRSAYWRAECPQ